MSKKLKSIPEFKNEDEEFEFWSTHDSTDYVDWSKAKVVRSSKELVEMLGLNQEAVTLELPKRVVVEIKDLAESLDSEPEQLMKQWVLRGLEEKGELMRGRKVVGVAEKKGRYRAERRG